MIVASIASFALVYLLYSIVENYRFVYASQAFEGASWLVVGAAPDAYIANLISLEKRGWAVGVYQRTMSLGWIVGPAMAGFLFETWAFAQLSHRGNG